MDYYKTLFLSPLKVNVMHVGVTLNLQIWKNKTLVEQYIYSE